MIGIVFLKFNDFIDELWGDEFWDELLTAAALPSEGVFTSTIIYDDQEFFTLCRVITDKKNISAKELQMVFGKFFFKTIYPHVPPSFNAHTIKDVLEFLHIVQNIIHAEVKSSILKR